MQIKTFERNARNDKAAEERQQLSAMQDNIQSEIARDVKNYYAKSWYLPLIFCLMFVASFVVAIWSTGDIATADWQAMSIPLATYTFGILVFNYLLFIF